jgi:hypothetical protein
MLLPSRGGIKRRFPQNNHIFSQLRITFIPKHHNHLTFKLQLPMILIIKVDSFRVLGRIVQDQLGGLCTGLLSESDLVVEVGWDWLF